MSYNQFNHSKKFAKYTGKSKAWEKAQAIGQYQNRDPAGDDRPLQQESLTVPIPLAE